MEFLFFPCNLWIFAAVNVIVSCVNRECLEDSLQNAKTETEKDDKKKVMQEVTNSVGLSHEGRGICFSIPVDNVVGLTDKVEFIKKEDEAKLEMEGLKNDTKLEETKDNDKQVSENNNENLIEKSLKDDNLEETVEKEEPVIKKAKPKKGKKSK